MTKVLFLDPPDCGCTDCLTGEARPINRAEDGLLIKESLGLIINRSGVRVDVSLKFDLVYEDTGRPVLR